MSRRLQIIRRTFRESVSDSPDAPTIEVCDTVLRVYGRAGCATSPDTDPDRLLFCIAQLLAGSAVDQHGWDLNGECITAYRNPKLSLTLEGDDREYGGPPVRKSKPVEELVLNASEVVRRGQVYWRCVVGSIVFPPYGRGYNDLTAPELLITSAAHLLPAHLRPAAPTRWSPGSHAQMIGRVNRKAQRPPARWIYKHEGD